MPVTSSRQDGAAILTISNPPRGYMDEALVAALAVAVEDALADPDIRVLILTGGDDGVFIRHYDVEAILTFADALTARAIPKPEGLPPAPVHRLIERLAEAPKPVIAAINGACMGGGFETALACDFRLAAPGDYPIGLPETNIGILPGAGGTQRLTRLIGPARAADAILRGRTFMPDAAAALGLIHGVSDGPVLAAALELARDLARRSAASLASAKAMIRAACHLPLDQGLTAERDAFARLLAEDPDATIRMRRFVEGAQDITRPA